MRLSFLFKRIFHKISIFIRHSNQNVNIETFCLLIPSISDALHSTYTSLNWFHCHTLVANRKKKEWTYQKCMWFVDNMEGFKVQFTLYIGDSNHSDELKTEARYYIWIISFTKYYDTYYLRLIYLCRFMAIHLI